LDKFFTQQIVKRGIKTLSDLFTVEGRDLKGFHSKKGTLLTCNSIPQPVHSMKTVPSLAAIIRRAAPEPYSQHKKGRTCTLQSAQEGLHLATHFNSKEAAGWKSIHSKKEAAGW